MVKRVTGNRYEINKNICVSLFLMNNNPVTIRSLNGNTIYDAEIGVFVLGGGHDNLKIGETMTVKDGIKISILDVYRKLSEQPTKDVLYAEYFLIRVHHLTKEEDIRLVTYRDADDCVANSLRRN